MPGTGVVQVDEVLQVRAPDATLSAYCFALLPPLEDLDLVPQTLCI